MITIRNDYNIRHLNTFRMDVRCAEWIEFDEPSDIPEVLAHVAARPWKTVGACSNMLFTGDYEGSLVHPAITTQSRVADGSGTVLLRVGAGVAMDELAEQTADEGLWGLENLSGIPGEAGAAAVQNVGAYGVEAKDVIAKIEAFDTRTGRTVVFAPDECAYGYRSSRFKSGPGKDRYIITHVTFRLSSVPRPVLDYGSLRERFASVPDITPADVRRFVLETRASKLPDVSETGSAGSFFKNPVLDADAFARLKARAAALPGASEPPFYQVGSSYKVPAAWLIEKSGLKGHTMGNAATWAKQPLVIVNATGKASPEEILALERYIVETVSNNFGVILSPEAEHI